MPKRLSFEATRCDPIRTEDKSERDRFYSGTRWRRLRALFLKRNPLCAECERDDRFTSATTVHHLVERLEDPSLAFKWSNLEASCSSCHTRRHKLKVKR